MTETTSTARRSLGRYRGCLVGVAVGDALGAPMEGRAVVTDGYLERLPFDPGPMRYTDDTAMTIGVAESLTAHGEFDGAHMAATLAAHYAAQPWRGYGNGPPEVFGNLERGVPWNQAAVSLFGGSGSYGNGAAMRVAPIALSAHPHTETVAELARQSAIITHTHPEGIDGAVAQALAIDYVLCISPKDTPDPTAMIAHIRPHLSSERFHEKLTTVEWIASERRTDQLPSLGSGITAHTSVPTALACYLLHPNSFQDAVAAAISLGGDTDTIASMTGALIGAHLGLAAIPPAWRRVEGFEYLTELADQLAHTSLR
ncbi:MAG TPA: ADP-ribosylglycohydrolase family protein [Acidimicrobiia bacterium]|nr:ADP-ribosylglycohydrolase family protein [Acidimicrobiia bacterium]